MAVAVHPARGYLAEEEAVVARHVQQPLALVEAAVEVQVHRK